MFNYKVNYKRTKFNPNPNSPNIFLKKLEHRYKKYYKDLYNSFNLENKKKRK